MTSRVVAPPAKTTDPLLWVNVPPAVCVYVDRNVVVPVLAPYVPALMVNVPVCVTAAEPPSNVPVPEIAKVLENPRVDDPAENVPPDTVAAPVTVTVPLPAVRVPPDCVNVEPIVKPNPVASTVPDCRLSTLNEIVPDPVPLKVNLALFTVTVLAIAACPPFKDVVTTFDPLTSSVLPEPGPSHVEATNNEFCAFTLPVMKFPSVSVTRPVAASVSPEATVRETPVFFATSRSVNVSVTFTSTVAAAPANRTNPIPSTNEPVAAVCVNPAKNAVVPDVAVYVPSVSVNAPVCVTAAVPPLNEPVPEITNVLENPSVEEPAANVPADRVAAPETVCVPAPPTNDPPDWA